MKRAEEHVRCVSYLRVSTQRQGRSGLGLEAQRESVTAFIKQRGWTLLQEVVEVETGKGSDALYRRPQLRAALDLCQRQKATLLVAKLDRLARNVHFLSGLLEAKVKFIAADLPEVNTLTLHVLAAVAQYERDMTSERTKEALARAKARGVRLGAKGKVNLRKVTDADRRHAYAQEHADRLRKTIVGLRDQGLTQQQIADELNALGLKSPRGKPHWYQPTVHRVLARLDVVQRD